MSFFAIGAMELLLLPLLGGGIPLGTPPLPEDPVMSRVAPEECLFYATWAGMAKPDANSENQTEQLLAEEEIQQLVVELEKRILDAIRQQAGDEPGVESVLTGTSELIKTLLTSPGAVFLSEAGIGPEGPDIKGGAIINLGDQADQVDQALLMLELMAFGVDAPGAIQDEGNSLNGWHSLPSSGGAPTVEWGIRGAYLIVGVGSGEADAILARGRAAAPRWLVELREELAVPRPSSFTYINLAQAIEMAETFGGDEIARPIETLGLGNLQSFSSVTGLDDVGCVSKGLLALDGEPVGLLSLALAEPLSKADLAPIPADATIALAARLDLNAYVAQILEAIGAFDPDAEQDILEELGQLEEFFGFRFRQDLFASLGDTWRVYGSPSEGSLFVTGATAVVDLRDADALAAVNEKLVTLVRAAFEEESAGRGRPRGVTIDSFPFGDETVYFLKFVGEEFPLAPAWCVTGEELIVATFPQHVKAYLANRAAAAGGSLAEAPEVARLFDSGLQPVAMSYVDTREIVRVFYPLLQMGARIFCAELQEEGIDIDVSLLPSAGTILRHMRPSVATFGRGDAGIVMETHQSLPGGQGAAVVLPMVAFMAVPIAMDAPGFTSPSVSSARSTNNLKQIGLALHNYHDTYRHFPADAYSDDGNPQLSWRVKILPFLEEMALYDEFHLDEPWNSPHNKQLIDRMPAVFNASGGEAGAARRTNYLGVAGEGGIFSGSEGLSFAAITDGTSNTVMVVEATDEEAVIWTRPDDFLFDEDKPTAGLVGLRRNGFLALFCDGSVRQLAETLDGETLKRLFSRNDGQPVSIPY